MFSRILVVLVLLVGLIAVPLLAEEPAGQDPAGRPAEKKAEEAKPDPIPPLATTEEAKEALARFKEEWKAKGYKGEEKTAMRERAMRKLAEVQHPRVTDRLFKLTGDRDENLRTLAVMYLGRQRALPGYAGPRVLKAVERNASDAVFVMFALDAVADLDYRMQVEFLRKLLRHKDEGVKKVAILAVGDMKEMRMLEDLLKLAKDLKIDKGWKTEGHEVRVDTGADTATEQRLAREKYKRLYGGSRGKARSGGRAMRDMKPILLESMKRLTGEEFFSRKHAVEWKEKNAEKIDEAKKALNELGLKQRADAEAIKKRK